MPGAGLRSSHLWIFVWVSIWGSSSLAGAQWGFREGPLDTRTTQGPIRGKILTLSDGEKVVAFLGIPFAEPPVGMLRFKPPVPRGRWDGIYNATTFGPLCVQSKNRSHWDIVDKPSGGKKILKRLGLWDYPQAEDCLNLNIYVPFEAWKRKHSNPARLSVMFYIHGGSYKTNGGRFYPGEWLASAGNVIVITVNYRLGVLGFLSTQDSAAEGNYGLLDQIIALEWVKENINNFGGNSTDVTLFGNSAGGACVGLHLLSPLSRGLFSKVIAQSGSPIGEWAVQKKPRMYVEQLAEKLDCLVVGDTASMVNCLRTVTTDEILEKSEEATLEDSLMLQFAPVVDGKFLPRPPIDMFQQEGSLAQVPTMLGLTRDELEVWMTKSYQDKDPSTIPFTKDLLRRYLMHLVRKEYMSDIAVDVLLHAVYAEYVFRHGTTSSHHKKRKQQHTMANGTSPYHEAPSSALPDIRTLGKIISDIDLKAPTVKLANLLSLHTNVSVFMYEFDYASSDDVIVTKYVGSYHESELYYIFGFPHMNLDNALRLSEDKEVSNMMIQLWSNFAKYGKPTPEGGYKKFFWTPYTEDEDNFATLGLQPFVARSYESERMVFWNHFVPLFTEYPIASSFNKSRSGTGTCSLELILMSTFITWLVSLLCLGTLLYICSCRGFRKFGVSIPA